VAIIAAVCTFGANIPAAPIASSADGILKFLSCESAADEAHLASEHLRERLPNAQIFIARVGHRGLTSCQFDPIDWLLAPGRDEILSND